MKTIRVRNEPAGYGFQAWLGDDNRVWERGGTQEEAIGKLVLSTSHQLGIAVEVERRIRTVSDLRTGDRIWHAVRWQTIENIERCTNGTSKLRLDGGETITLDNSLGMPPNMAMAEGWSRPAAAEAAPAPARVVGGRR